MTAITNHQKRKIPTHQFFSLSSSNLVTDISSICKASFFQDDDSTDSSNNGVPLHSTALEENIKTRKSFPEVQVTSPQIKKNLSVLKTAQPNLPSSSKVNRNDGPVTQMRNKTVKWNIKKNKTISKNGINSKQRLTRKVQSKKKVRTDGSNESAKLSSFLRLPNVPKDSKQLEKDDSGYTMGNMNSRLTAYNDIPSTSAKLVSKRKSVTNSARPSLRQQKPVMDDSPLSSEDSLSDEDPASERPVHKKRCHTLGKRRAAFSTSSSSGVPLHSTALEENIKTRKSFPEVQVTSPQIKKNLSVLKTAQPNLPSSSKVNRNDGPVTQMRNKTVKWNIKKNKTISKNGINSKQRLTRKVQSKKKVRTDESNESAKLSSFWRLPNVPKDSKQLEKDDSGDTMGNMNSRLTAYNDIPSTSGISVSKRKSVTNSARPSLRQQEPVMDDSPLSSEDSLSDEDPALERPVNKKRCHTLGKRRAAVSTSSSSGKSDHRVVPERKSRKATELDVVLSEFQKFSLEYREMLESGDCRNIMERFSKRFSDHLVETIEEVKGIKDLRRKTTKVVNTLEMKRKQLLTMKHELIRSECYMKKLEKDYAEMKQRYCDLKNSTTFLSDLKNMKELLEKNKHGKRAKPVYGLTSLPALLLEAEGIMGAETKLHNINKKLEKSIILDSCAK
ncbi:uncharacterized protein cenpu isoform X2 [Polypterus senegalus]|uniref:uncharacterized protein cenpu isoform X2 n=1 Tax=Polypterus senegalus TaxID=55291 RepID=UPI001962EB11|nr:uncharacterized protein cenpu isoform X2 [Polypterus senegalus]